MRLSRLRSILALLSSLGLLGCALLPAAGPADLDVRSGENMLAACRTPLYLSAKNPSMCWPEQHPGSPPSSRIGAGPASFALVSATLLSSLSLRRLPEDYSYHPKRAFAPETSSHSRSKPWIIAATFLFHMRAIFAPGVAPGPSSRTRLSRRSKSCYRAASRCVIVQSANVAD